MNGVINGETLIGTITTDETLTGVLTNPKNIDLSGDTITPEDLRSGVKAHNSSGIQITGSMVDNGAITRNISTKNEEYVINEGYHNGNGKISIDSSEQEKIIPGNIKKDVNILGVTGILEASNLNWGIIGYNEEPQVIQDSYNYAVEIKNNWTPAVSLNYKFNNNYDLKIMPLVDTSSTTIMSGMFNNCYGLISIPSLNTSNVTQMDDMFNTTSIYTIPLLDTSKVTTMQRMFNKCNCLKSIPSIDTSKVTTMQNMFYQCRDLHSVPLLNTSKVTTMRNMFYFCPNLTDESLDNILQMCINTTSAYTRPKTLSELGFYSSEHSASQIQSLPHYQDFINAGWTIGY